MPDTDLQDILAALKDVEFPADKHELVQAAAAAGASESAVAALWAIPQASYANWMEVARSVAARPASGAGSSPAQRAERARQRTRRRQLAHYWRVVGKPAMPDELEP